MISTEITSEPDNNWNKRLLDSSLGTIHQTKEFAQYTKEVKKQNPHFIKYISENGKIIGQLILIEHSRFNKKGFSGKIYGKISGQSNLMCRWKFGPIIFDSNYGLDICNSLRKNLLSKNCKVKGTENPLLSGSLSEIGKPFRINQWGTFLIDLSKGTKKIWDKMDKHSAQKNIKRSEKRGVIIKEITKNDLVTFHELIKESKKNANDDVSLSKMEVMWDILHQIGLTGFLAYENNSNPVGGILASFFNGYINEFEIVRSQRDTDAKLYSQDLLKWKIIQCGIDKKLKYYDLSGVNPNPNDKKEQGIFRYKKKWGGKPITYNLITL